MKNGAFKNGDKEMENCALSGTREKTRELDMGKKYSRKKKNNVERGTKGRIYEWKRRDGRMEGIKEKEQREGKG